MGMRLLRHEKYERVFVCSLHEMDPSRSSPCMQTDLLRELGWKSVRAFGVYGGLKACKDIYLCNRSPERLCAHIYGGTEDRRASGRSHSQLLVSLATAMMPMGCWGMSTRSSFMSLPTYLLARCTARRTQSVQKICSPYTANPKGWTGSDFRITC